ncbi:hypothetical protein ES692_06105 [Psychroserpens burtonensis]|uniref:Uncharacterized protein n=1 Tax=Psychroserpens burtonensis TaxID=49278 RepID=A0A5C7BA73_9FLAO|nr:hypothetical protein [Psychroserpens burtonensis]TXE18614.1 hypothetical protein ES692_06105 [Psychroserpens burtonensis]
MPTKNYQLVPFTVPEHLVYYFCKKLGTDVEVLNADSSCTALVISKHTFYGQKIYSTLGKATYHKTPKTNFYLKISNDLRTNYPSYPDGRYVNYTVDKETYYFVERHLQQLLKTELMSFVGGAVFAHHNLKGTKKGITHKAITQFMMQNHIPLTETSFENLRKLHYRTKKSGKAIVIK